MTSTSTTIARLHIIRSNDASSSLPRCREQETQTELDDEYEIKTTNVEEKRSKYLRAFKEQLDGLRHAKTVFMAAEEKTRIAKEYGAKIQADFIDACIQHDQLRTKLEDLNATREALTTSITVAMHKNATLSANLLHANKRKKKAMQKLSALSSSAESIESDISRTETRNAELRSVLGASLDAAKLLDEEVSMLNLRRTARETEIEKLSQSDEQLAREVESRCKALSSDKIKADAFLIAMNAAWEKELVRYEAARVDIMLSRSATAHLHPPPPPVTRRQTGVA